MRWPSITRKKLEFGLAGQVAEARIMRAGWALVCQCNYTAVDVDHRDDLRGRARKKRFVRDVNIVRVIYGSKF